MGLKRFISQMNPEDLYVTTRWCVVRIRWSDVREPWRHCVIQCRQDYPAVVASVVTASAVVDKRRRTAGISDSMLKLVTGWCEVETFSFKRDFIR